jgi:hypothetical protein
MQIGAMPRLVILAGPVSNKRPQAAMWLLWSSCGAVLLQPHEGAKQWRAVGETDWNQPMGVSVGLLGPSGTACSLPRCFQTPCRCGLQFGWTARCCEPAQQLRLPGGHQSLSQALVRGGA